MITKPSLKIFAASALLFAGCSHLNNGRSPNNAATLPMSRDHSQYVQKILTAAGFAQKLSIEENIRAMDIECTRSRFPTKEEANPLECMGAAEQRKISIQNRPCDRSKNRNCTSDAGMLFAIMQQYTSLQDYPGAIYIKLQKITCNRDEANPVCEVELP